MKQLGYPMLYKPRDKLLEGFLWHDKGDPTLLKKIIWAWGNVHKKGRHLRKGIQVIKELYNEWIIQRNQDIKLTFIISPPLWPTSPDPVPISHKEVDELRTFVLRLEQEKEELQVSLNKVSYERNELRFNLNQNDKHLKEREATVEDEKKKRKRVSDYLVGE